MDPTEVELIARIVEDPDDEPAYLVYADWLIGRGDPRGELIALHRAIAGEPGKARAAERHLRANRARLLGTLAEYDSQIKLEWHLGFVRRARVVADDSRSATALVDEVIRSPACRFLMRLEVVILGKQRSYLEVERRIAERAEPATLRELVLGRPGEHSPSDELVAAFPRLARRAADWGAIVAAVKALRGRAPELDVGELSPLTERYGEVLPLDDTAILRGLAAEVGRKQPLGLVAMLQATCDPGTLDRYAGSLVWHWYRAGQVPATAWVYDVAALIGGTHAAHAIGWPIEGLSHARAAHALACLARMRTPLAVLELFAASRLWSSRGEVAEELLARRAAEAGTTVADLLAHAVAELGDLEDEAAARAGELDRVAIEHLLVTGWTTTLATAQELFATSPRARLPHSAAHLVWGKPKPVEPPTLGSRLRFWDRAPRGSVTPFAITHAGAVDLDGKPVDVAPDDAIGLAHPLELAPDDRERWWAWQVAHPPPFDQLDREWARAGRLALEQFPSFTALRRRGFRNGGRQNVLHQETLLVKRYAYRGKTYTVRVDFRAETVTSVPSELPVVVQHELARDLLAALD